MTKYCIADALCQQPLKINGKLCLPSSPKESRRGASHFSRLLKRLNNLEKREASILLFFEGEEKQKKLSIQNFPCPPKGSQTKAFHFSSSLTDFSKATTSQPLNNLERSFPLKGNNIAFLNILKNIIRSSGLTPHLDPCIVDA